MQVLTDVLTNPFFLIVWGVLVILSLIILLTCAGITLNW
jgi:hypothetical protein